MCQFISNSLIKWKQDQWAASLDSIIGFAPEVKAVPKANMCQGP